MHSSASTPLPAPALPPVLRRSTAPPSEWATAVWGRVFNARLHPPNPTPTTTSSSSSSTTTPATTTPVPPPPPPPSAAASSREPAVVVRPRTPAHVAAAVRLAADEGRRVAVRAGGHSWAGWAVRADSVLVDLVELGLPGREEAGRGEEAAERQMDYDEPTHTVRCTPAVTGERLNHYLAPFGRVFPGGHCPDVGLGGFLLQGGMGWNCKNWGWACEYVTAVEVVTADGRIIKCDEQQNADLFWAARGAGPGFPAIVTSFHLRTRPLTGMHMSLYFYPVEAYATVLQWVVDISPTADPSTEIVCVSMYPPSSASPQILASFVSFLGDPSSASAALSPLHASRPPGATTEVFCKPTDLAEQYCAQRTANPDGRRYASDDAYVRDDADVVAVLRPAFTSLPTRQSAALYFAMAPTSRRHNAAVLERRRRGLREEKKGLRRDGVGGSDAAPPDMALSLQSDHYFAVYAVWDRADEDARCAAWVRGVFAAAERHSVGSYLGDADFRVRSAVPFWSPEAGERLRDARRDWDPEGRICGYLERGDRGDVDGLENMFDWENEGDEEVPEEEEGGVGGVGSAKKTRVGREGDAAKGQEPDDEDDGDNERRGRRRVKNAALHHLSRPWSVVGQE